MSGHSKWSKVKHQKATTDVVKAQAFTKASRLLTIAVREGGGISDPNLNFRLRLAIEKARYVNMPKDTIARAIERGTGTDAEGFSEVTYEGYGPGGVAVYIIGATDNRQRTVGAVKNIFDRVGGTLSSPGAVAYQFTRAGLVIVPKSTHTYDEIMETVLDAGAEDVVEEGDVFEIYTPPDHLADVRSVLEKHGMTPDNTELIMKPTSSVMVDSVVEEKLDGMIDELESLDDVQHVYTNAKML